MDGLLKKYFVIASKNREESEEERGKIERADELRRQIFGFWGFLKKETVISLEDLAKEFQRVGVKEPEVLELCFGRGFDYGRGVLYFDRTQIYRQDGVREVIIEKRGIEEL